MGGARDRGRRRAPERRVSDLFGGVEGVVTVTPKGETYDLVIDPAPLLAQIPGDSGLKVEIGALTYHLTDNGDGSWGVTENQTMSWSFVIPGVMEQTGSAQDRIDRHLGRGPAGFPRTDNGDDRLYRQFDPISGAAATR
jgi:hypothetical protein